MRRITQTFITLLLYASAGIIFSVFLTGCDDGGGLSKETRIKIDNAVECQMLEKLVPGISISVVKNGKTLYRRGYGKADIESGTDVRPETKFALGSVTKIFTAIGVLNL